MARNNIYLSLILCSLIWAISLNSQASRIAHSGANCKAANQAQANLMTWGKDGIENNSSIDLYVVCPVPIDVDLISPTFSTKLRINVSMWLPPDYGNVGDVGPFCVARYAGVGIYSDALTNDIWNLSGKSGFLSHFMGSPGISGSHSVGSIVLERLQIFGSGDPQAHLICILPKNGGTLQSYSGQMSG